MHKKPEVEDTQKIPAGTTWVPPDGVPRWDKGTAERVLKHYENQAYHHVDHTETYNQPWVDGETGMTLEEIGKRVDNIWCAIGAMAVGILAVLLIVLLK